MKFKYLFIVLFVGIASVADASNQTIILNSENGAYAPKADDGKWVVIREIPFHVGETSVVTFTANMTVNGVSDAITNHNVIAGILKLNILQATGLSLSHDIFDFNYSLAGNAGSTLTLPIHGESTVVNLAPGDYKAVAQIYSPAKSGNNYLWRYKKGLAKVQVIQN